MALLGVVVQVLGRPVPCLPADDPTDGPPIRGVQVSGDPCGLSFGDLDEPPQEPTCGMLVAALAQRGVRLHQGPAPLPGDRARPRRVCPRRRVHQRDRGAAEARLPWNVPLVEPETPGPLRARVLWPPQRASPGLAGSDGRDDRRPGRFFSGGGRYAWDGPDPVRGSRPCFGAWPTLWRRSVPI